MSWKGATTFLMSWKGGSSIFLFFHFLCLKPCFPNNLVEVLSNFWRKWVMKLRIWCPPNTKFSYARGRFPLTTPATGPVPCTPCEHLAHKLSFPQLKMEWRACIGVRKGGSPRPHFWWQSGEFKIGGSMESLVEMGQIEKSLWNYAIFWITLFSCMF